MDLQLSREQKAGGENIPSQDTMHTYKHIQYTYTYRVLDSGRKLGNPEETQAKWGENMKTLHRLFVLSQSCGISKLLHFFKT